LLLALALGAFVFSRASDISRFKLLAYYGQCPKNIDRQRLLKLIDNYLNKNARSADGYYFWAGVLAFNEAMPAEALRILEKGISVLSALGDVSRLETLYNAIIYKQEAKAQNDVSG